MHLFDCGYFMQQDYFKSFVYRAPHCDEEYCDSVTLLMDVSITHSGWFKLPRNIRDTTHLPGSAYPCLL